MRPNQSVTGMSDWWVTERIFPPSPLEPGIPFLNHLSLYSILHSSTSLLRVILQKGYPWWRSSWTLCDTLP